MSNLVNGYEDILPASNLAGNGNFHINQRGNFGSLTPVVVNDYVCDLWKVTSLSLDYCEVYQHNNGFVQFKGHGKKGQLVQIKNRSTEESFGWTQGFIHSDVNADNLSLTGSVMAAVTEGKILLTVSPRYQNGAVVDLFNLSPVVNAGETKRAIRVRKTAPNSITVGGFFSFILQQDGDFDVYIEAYSELAGAFKNPPTNVVVPYAEDLQRCERYYQVGSVAYNSIPIRGDGASMYMYHDIDFRTMMAGTPSMSASLTAAHFYQLAELGTGVTGADQANWSPSFQSVSNIGAALFMQRTHIASRSVLDVDLDWTAAVA